MRETLKSIEFKGDTLTMYKKENQYTIVRDFHDSNQSVIMYPTEDPALACEVWDKILESLNV